MKENYEVALKKEDLLVICSWCDKIFLGKSQEEREDPKNWLSRKDDLYKYNQLYMNHTWDLSKTGISNTICPPCYEEEIRDD